VPLARGVLDHDSGRRVVDHHPARRRLRQVHGLAVDQRPPEQRDPVAGRDHQAVVGHGTHPGVDATALGRDGDAAEALATGIGVGSDQRALTVVEHGGLVAAVRREGGRLVQLTLDPLRLGVVAPPVAAIGSRG
jgi:hypothetical protein